MANNSNVMYDSMQALPNKLLQPDGAITDMKGNEVTDSVLSYESKKALPNKFLNPDGTYSTLDEIISAVDSDIFIIVDELPATGDSNKIYLLPNDNGGFTEYHYTNGKWDPVGDVTIDLTNYPTKTDMIAAINAALQEAKQYTDTQIGTALNTSY